MEYIKCDIDGPVVIRPVKHNDVRGYFMETFRLDDFRKNVADTTFVQENESCSTKGVIRGLHFQAPPFAQAKLVRCVKGRVLDVAVEDEGHQIQKVCEFTLLDAAELTYRLETRKLKQIVTLKAEERSGSYRRSTYEVKKGDSLKGIAKQFGLTIFELASLNQVFNDVDLREGAILKLPLKKRKA